MSKNVNEIISEMSRDLTDLIRHIADSINENLANNVKMGSTNLGRQIAEDLDKPEQLCVALASEYVKRHDDLATRQGPGGGIYRISDIEKRVSEKSKSTKTAKALPFIKGLSDVNFTKSTSVGTATPVSTPPVSTVSVVDDDMDADFGDDEAV